LKRRVITSCAFWSFTVRNPANINVNELVTITHSTYETTRSIDDPSNMKDDQVNLE